MALYLDKNLPYEERAIDLLNKMTLKEKVGQLNQHLYGFAIYEKVDDAYILSDEFKEEVELFQGLGVLYGLYRADPWSKKDYTSGIDRLNATKVYNQVQRYVLEHSRLKIPMLLSTESPHGHQALDGYLLPVNLATGATFNVELLEDAYRVCGKQLREMGVDLALISVLDVLRDPRWGRSEECFSEDPYLASQFAKAAVRGCQDADVYVVAKHFCAQGETTGGVNASAARIGERELREIHLPPMKASCEVNVKGVMAAYNEIDGIPCHGNKRLLEGILREEFGFSGIVMADGTAVDCLDVITRDNVQSGALALRSGIDVSLWDTGFKKLDIALEKGYVTIEDIDRSVMRVLMMKFERGLFENPYLEEKEISIYDYQTYPESLELTRQSVVMLENKNQILPLKKEAIKSIAVIGPNADNIYNQLGDYTPPVKEGITVLDGIRNFIGDSAKISFMEGCDLIDETEDIEGAVALAEAADVVVLVLGGSSSRFKGVTFDKNGAAISAEGVTMDCGEGVDSGRLTLPGKQVALAEAIFKTNKPVITVLVQGRPYAIPEIQKGTDGLLCAFYPGVMGGQGIAEILFGEVSPSGRLPVSIPRHVGQLPVYYNPKSSYKRLSYYDIDQTPLYSFGEGQSYTTFKYDNIHVQASELDAAALDKQDFVISFDVENTGNYDSFCVPQLYIKDLQSTVVTRLRELKAFCKVWIPSKEKKQVSLALSKDSLSIWNQEMHYVVEPGDIELYLEDMGKNIWTGIITVKK